MQPVIPPGTPESEPPDGSRPDHTAPSCRRNDRWQMCLHRLQTEGDNKCKETKHCKNQLIYIYLIVTGIAIVFLVCFVIYFVCVIKEIRKNVKQIQIANSDKAEQINQANQENERNKSE